MILLVVYSSPSDCPIQVPLLLWGLHVRAPGHVGSLSEHALSTTSDYSPRAI